MTLEEYRNQSRNIKRNPNAKITEEKTTVITYIHVCNYICITYYIGNSESKSSRCKTKRKSGTSSSS